MTEQTNTQINANFNALVDLKEVKYNFRKVKDAETGVETKRASVELSKLPVPSVEGIVAILESGDDKAMSLLLEAVADVVINRARDVINENEAITSDNFDYSVCDWTAIANLEKEDRRSGISKETWDDFALDYVEIMPAVSGTSKEQSANAAKIFVGKFASIKSKKDVIGKLKLRLSVYAEHSPRASEFSEVIDFLFKKADKLIAAKEESLEDNLGL